MQNYYQKKYNTSDIIDMKPNPIESFLILNSLLKKIKINFATDPTIAVTVISTKLLLERDFYSQEQLQYSYLISDLKANYDDNNVESLNIYEDKIIFYKQLILNIDYILSNINLFLINVGRH